ERRVLPDVQAEPDLLRLFRGAFADARRRASLARVALATRVAIATRRLRLGLRVVAHAVFARALFAPHVATAIAVGGAGRAPAARFRQFFAAARRSGRAVRSFAAATRRRAARQMRRIADLRVLDEDLVRRLARAARADDLSGVVRRLHVVEKFAGRAAD